MQDYDNARNVPREPFFAKTTRWIGVGSSLLVVGGLAYWAYNLGSRDAANVPVFNALTENLRTEPEVIASNETAQSNQVNGVLEGTPPKLTNDVTLAPEPTDLDAIAPATQDGVANAEVLDEFILADETVLPIVGPERRPELLFIPPKDQLNQMTAEAEPLGDPVDDLVVEDAGTTEQVSKLPKVTTPSEVAPEVAPESVVVAEAASEAVDETALAKIAEEVRKSEAAAEEAAAATAAKKLETKKAQEAAQVEEAAPKPVATGSSMIQLAANTTLEDTQNQWIKLQAAHGDILGDKSLSVQKATVKGKIYYRLRVAGFADTGTAKEACATLTSRGLQCMLVK